MLLLNSLIPSSMLYSHISHGIHGGVGGFISLQVIENPTINSLINAVTALIVVSLYIIKRMGCKEIPNAAA